MIESGTDRLKRYDDVKCQLLHVIGRENSSSLKDLQANSELDKKRIECESNNVVKTLPANADW
jgi:hypothetical protein